MSLIRGLGLQLTGAGIATIGFRSGFWSDPSYGLAVVFLALSFGISLVTDMVAEPV